MPPPPLFEANGCLYTQPEITIMSTLFLQQFNELTDSFIKRIHFLVGNELETRTAIACTIAQEMRNALSEILTADKQQVSTRIKSSMQKLDMTLLSLSDKPLCNDAFKLNSAKDLINQALEEYAYDDKQRDLIEVCGVDCDINVEPNFFKHVFWNLLQNALFAIKTKSHAKIVITLKPDIAGEHCIEFHDNGPGIPPQQIPILFDTYITLTKEGMGLGLPFCKRTMKAFGGDIHCESQVGNYTHFILSFPIP